MDVEIKTRAKVRQVIDRGEITVLDGEVDQRGRFDEVDLYFALRNGRSFRPNLRVLNPGGRLILAVTRVLPETEEAASLVITKGGPFGPAERCVPQVYLSRVRETPDLAAAGVAVERGETADVFGGQITVPATEKFSVKVTKGPYAHGKIKIQKKF
jgi:hypothetical protein